MLNCHQWVPNTSKILNRFGIFSQRKKPTKNVTIWTLNRACLLLATSGADTMVLCHYCYVTVTYWKADTWIVYLYDTKPFIWFDDDSLKELSESWPPTEHVIFKWKAVVSTRQSLADLVQKAVNLDPKEDLQTLVDCTSDIFHHGSHLIITRPNDASAYIINR